MKRSIRAALAFAGLLLALLPSVAAAQSLTVSNLASTSATVTISSHTGDWFYDISGGTNIDCTNANISGSSVNLTGLTPNSRHTFSAFTSCSGPPTIRYLAEVDFTTLAASPTLTASSVEATTATLTITNHTGAWYYKYTVPATPAGSCSSEVASGTTTASLTDLTAGTSYTFKAYSDSTCATELTGDATDAEFTTSVSGAGLTLSATTVALTEGGAAGTYTVRLAAQPVSDVTVTVSSGDSGAVTASPATLTFTRTGTKIWSSAQTVTLTPLDDTDTTGESVTITHTAAGGGYNGLSATLTATVSDEAILAVSGINDTGATLTISNHGGVAWWYKDTSGITSCTSVGAGTTTASPTWPGALNNFTYKAYSAANCGSDDELASVTFGTIQLDPLMSFYDEGDLGSLRVTLPAVLLGSANVTVTLTNPDTTALTLGQTTCTFVPQGPRSCPVSLTTLQDADYAQEAVAISGTASGGGGLYSGSIGSASATISDDDGIVPSMSTVRLTEGGGTGSFTVKLAGAPTDNVTMTVTSWDTGAVTRSPASLTFTTDNWNTPQTVTLTPVDDGDSNHESVTIRLIASGGGYGARTSVTAKVSDDEGAQLAASAVTPTTATLTLTNHTPSTWWYKKTLPTPAGNCTSGPSDKSLELSNLTASTNYTYKAYNASSCADANEIAEQSFSTSAAAPTPTLTASSVEATTATLTIANHTGTWYHKYTTPSSGTCSSAVSTTTANLTGLTPGTSYTYKAYSDSTCATELATAAAFLTKPGQVTGAAVTPGNASLGVSWTAPAGTVTGYKVQWKSGQQNYNTGDRQKTVTSGTTATITGLTNATTYTVRVTAYNNTGDGTASAEVTGTPAAPTPTLTASAVQATTATLTIANHTGAWYHKYTVPATPAGSCSSMVAGGTATASLTGLTGGTSYTYKAYSDSTCATELTGDATDAEFTTKPAQVTGVSVTGYHQRVEVNWTATTGATGYTVQWKSGNQSFGTDRQATTTNNYYSITGLISGTVYTVQVKATNGTGDGAWSNAATGTANTATLSASSVQTTAATLTLLNWPKDWYYKHTTPPNGTCSTTATMGVFANLTGLTAGTSYTYKAYSDSTCATEVATAAAFLTKPGQVTGAAVTPGNASLGVSWTAPAGTVTGYKVQWKSGQQNYNTGDRQKTVTSGTTTTITGLTNATAHTVRVTAYNATGDGAASAEVTGTPAAPTPTLTASSVQATTATLTIANHSGDWHYKANAAPDASCSSTAVTGTTKSLTGLSGNTDYTYKAYGDSSCSNELTGNADDADFLTKPAEPTQPGAVSGAGSGKLTLSATVTGAGTLTGWKYQQKEGNGNYGSWQGISSTSTTLSHVVSGLTDGTNYQFKVLAVNATGDGVASDASAAAQPRAATLGAGNVTHNSATLTIGNHTGNWHHKYTDPATPAGSCSTNAVTGATASLTGLSGNTKYTYKAYSDSTCTAGNLVATAPEFLTKPGTPVKPTATAAGSGKLTLASSVTGSGTLTKWKYQQKEGNGNYGQWKDISSTSATLSHTVVGLTDGNSYQFKVLAANATGDGQTSAESDAAQPLDETLTASSVEATTATLTIGNHSGSWYYKRTAPTATSCSSEQTGTAADLTGLDGNASYDYKAYGNTSCTAELAEETFLTKPAKPSKPTAAAGSGSGKLLLASSVAGGSGSLSKWQYSQDGGTTWKDINVTATTLSHVISNLIDGTSYSFKVRAENATGTGPDSDASDGVAPISETLEVSNVTHSSAKLTISGRTGGWWYKGGQSGATCRSVASGTTEVTISGLDASTEYTYTVYDKQNCVDALLTLKFTTLERTDVDSGVGTGSGSPRPTPGGMVCGVNRPFVRGVASASAPSLDNRYKAGDAIVIAVTFSQPVRIFGNGPALKFTLGSGVRTAGYTGGTGTATLRFSYQVVEGDKGGLGIPADALAGNTGKVHDLCGLGATFEVEAAALPHQVGGSIHVPMLPSASDPGRQGFVRVINHSGKSGEAAITAIDDDGNRFGPVTLAIGARASTHFNTTDLEDGNAAKGLSGGTGPGQGNWRLEVDSGLEVEAIGYVRHIDGFLTTMQGVAPMRGGAPYVATFNPADNYRQVSRLRLFNAGGARASVSLAGIDDLGQSPGTAVRLTLAAGAAVGHDADALESGTGLDGALGDGAGKWRLTPSAAPDVTAMSLMESPSGHLTNLSTAPANRHGDALVLPLFLSAADPHQRQGFARIINHSDRAGTVSIQAFDDSSWKYDPLTLSIGAKAAVHFNSDDLELGNPDKGLAGSTGAGSSGDWWLSLTSDLDIEALAYVRHQHGFLTSMHDVAPKRGGVHRVAIFNPASNDRQVSQLRIVNLGTEPAQVTIKGIDGNGASPGTDVAVTVPARRSVTLDAKALEEGGDGFEGALGDGASKWRLEVESEQPILVMSLMQSPTHQLTNLSARPMQADL